MLMLFVPILLAGVHDSYWTHACDVDQMNRILREKFVELYDAPILENVSSFFKSCPSRKTLMILTLNKLYFTSNLHWILIIVTSKIRRLKHIASVIIVNTLLIVSSYWRVFSSHSLTCSSRHYRREVISI